MEIFAEEQRDNQTSEFFNNYPKGWQEFQAQNANHYFITLPSEPGKPRVQVEIHVTPLDNWGRYEVEVRVYGKMYDEYNFMQTKSFENERPFLLDKGWEYNFGFYLSNLDLVCYSADYYRKGSDGYFQDRPSAFAFSAELSLFGKRNNYWEYIQTYNWGYSIQNGALEKEYFKINPNPSNLQQDYIKKILNHWNNQ